MKKTLALCAVVLLCAAAGIPLLPAHPYTITTFINGQRYVVPNTHGGIHSMHGRLVKLGGHPYAEIVLRHVDGSFSYFTLDSNELHLQAQ